MLEPGKMTYPWTRRKRTFALSSSVNAASWLTLLFTRRSPMAFQAREKTGGRVSLSSPKVTTTENENVSERLVHWRSSSPLSPLSTLWWKRG